MRIRFDKACTCSQSRPSHGPHRERDETPEALVEHLSIADRDDFEKAMSSYYVAVASHEAAHVIAAYAAGRGVQYTTIGGGAPHVRYIESAAPMSVLDSAIGTTAGPVAERLCNNETYSPTWSSLCGVIRKARAEEAGSCDSCRVARTLVTHFPDCPDEMLVESWFGAISCTHALLADAEVRAAHAALAAELHEQTLLEQERIEEIIAPFDLAGAMDRALEPIDLAETLPAWRLELK